MDKESYQKEKERIYNLYGKPEYDFDRTPFNESARQLAALKAKAMADGRHAANAINNAKDKELEAVELTTQPTSNAEADTIRKKLKGLNEIILTDVDLKGFNEIEREILRLHFADRQLQPKELANRVGKPYQFVAGFLKSKGVLLLKARYFHETLGENTQIALLRLTQHADPKVVLAAADYLKLLTKENDTSNAISRVDDPLAEKCLELLGDWLVSKSPELKLTKSL